jgi:ribosome-associated protein
VNSDDRATLHLATGVGLESAEILWRFSTSGGPGGQHVNTSHTRAEATLDVAHSASLPEWARLRICAKLGPVVSISASDTRSQSRNRALALARLVAKLSQALEEPKRRRPTRPSASATRRRLDSKRMTSMKKLERRRPAPGEE